MFNFYLLSSILLISLIFFFLGNDRAKKLIILNQKNLHSLTHYYGVYSLLASLLPTLGLFFVFTNDNQSESIGKAGKRNETIDGDNNETHVEVCRRLF